MIPNSGEIAVLRRQIRHVTHLAASVQALYNELFTPELWKAGENLNFQRMKLEEKLKELTDQFPVNP